MFRLLLLLLVVAPISLRASSFSGSLNWFWGGQSFTVKPASITPTAINLSVIAPFGNWGFGIKVTKTDGTSYDQHAEVVYDGNFTYYTNSTMASVYFYPVHPQSAAGATGGITFLLDNAQTGSLPQQVFSTASHLVSDPVNFMTGAFYQNATDLVVSAPLPIKVTRTYTSSNNSNSELGFGWLTGNPSYLIPSNETDNPEVIQAADEDGSVFTFRKQGITNIWLPLPKDNPQLGNMAEGRCNPLISNLVQTINGGVVSYQWNLSNGYTRSYIVGQFPRTIAGTNYTCRRPYLSSVADEKGNRIDFTFGTNNAANDYGLIKKITASSGADVTFVYNSDGRILTATANDGRTVAYDYYTNGDLMVATLPDNSTTAYIYGESSPGVSNHLIIRETKPNGRVLENDYDSQGRVTYQRATVDPAQPGVLILNATFNYSVPGQTTVTDAYGNDTIYEHSDSLVTAIREPQSRTTLKEWYGVTDTATGAYQRSLAKVTDPRGLVTEYKYDAQGNVIETKLTGDLDGDPTTAPTETRVATAHYNTLNRPDWTADSATGLTTDYLYEDSDYPYLPTILTTKQTSTNSTIRTDRLDYTERSAPATAPATGTISARGLLAAKTIALGSADEALTTHDYDATGFRISETRHTGTADPDVSLTFAPTARREIFSITDAASRVTEFTYDELSRPLTRTVRDATGTTLATTTTTYNASGEISCVDGPRSGPEDWVEQDYDQAGRPSEARVWRVQAKADGSGVEAPAAAALKAVTTTYHDLFGNLVLAIDPRGHATTHQYDALGRLTHTRRFDAVHTAALLAQYTADLAAKRAYDGSLPSGVTALSLETRTYEPGGQIETLTDVLGGQTTTLYTTLGQPRRRTLPDGSVQEWRYRIDGRLDREILRNGTYWQNTYDDVARTTARTLKTATGTTLSSETRTYDRRGNLGTFTDAESATFTTTYDDLDRVKTSTGPDATSTSAQQSTTTAYDDAGITVVTTNALGESTVTTRDALGRVTRLEVFATPEATTPLRVTAHAYATGHHSVTTTEGTGTTAIVTTTYTDPAGRPLLTRHADGTFTRQTYDLAGLPSTFTDALNRTTTTTHDALGHLATLALPDGPTTTTIHDAAGGLLERRMPSPQGLLVAKTIYDTAGRPTSSRLLNGASETRVYGHTYYPATHATWAGLPKDTTDPRGIVRTQTYDDFLRPLALTTEGPTPETDTTTTYAYDLRHRLTSATQTYADPATGPPTSVTRTPDAYGHLTAETVNLDGATHSSLAQTWDAAGRRHRLTPASAALGDYVFTHRADGRLTQVAATPFTAHFTFGDNGLLTSRTNPLRNLTVDLRDTSGRILTQTTAVNGTTVMLESQTWRDDGTLEYYGVTREGAGVWDESRDYGYNTRGQLTSEGFSPAPAATAALEHTFDHGVVGLGVRTDAKIASGAPAAWQTRVPSASAINAFARVTTDETNAVGKPIPANGAAFGADYVELWINGSFNARANHPGWADATGAWSKTLTLDAGAQTLTSRAVHPSGKFAATATSTFTVNVPLEEVGINYDAEGNVTSRTFNNGTAQTLTWDAFNRLVKVTQRDSANNGYDWSAVYDAFGRRLKTTQQPITSNVASASATITTSIYDPEAEFLEIGVAVNGMKAWKVYGPDLTGTYGAWNGTGGLEATILEVDGTVKGVVNDAFGNGVATVKGTAITWTPTRVGGYGPLPNIRAEVLTDVTRLAEVTAWRGRRIDPTGFYNLGARHYDYLTGRFLSPDPMGHAASMSLYDFANGDPVNGFDPDGRFGKAFYKEYIGLGERLNSGFVGAYDFGQDMFAAGFLATAYQNSVNDYQFNTNAFNDPNRPTVYGGYVDAGALIGTFQTGASVGTFGLYNVGVGGYDLATGDYNSAQNNFAVGFVGLASLHVVTSTPIAATTPPVRAPLAGIFDGHPTGQGFSGVFDPKTGAVLMKPSSYTTPPPAGSVSARGGHLTLSNELGRDLNHVGFTGFLEQGGGLRIEWLSRSVNGPNPNFPGPVVPEALRPPVLDAIKTATGRAAQ